MDESAPRPRKARLARPGKAFWVTIGGVVALLNAILLAGGAVSAARLDSAYAAARPCTLPAAWDADCVQHLPGTVNEVVNTSGKGAQHQLDVTTANGDQRIEFPRENPIVASVLDGAPVTLTVWRAHIVSVSWEGVDATTEDAPQRHLHNVVAGMLVMFGIALLLLPAVGFTRLAGAGRRPRASVAFTFATIATFLAAFPMLAGALASAIGMAPVPDFVTIAGFLVPALASAAWLTSRSLAAQSRRVKVEKRLAASRKTPSTSSTKVSKSTSTLPPHPRTGPPRPRPRSRSRSRATAADFWGVAFILLGIVAVVTFIAAAAQDIPGRSHDHSPFCAAGVDDTSCRADTPLRVYGTRTNNSDLTIFFVGPDGTRPAATFDDDPVVWTTAQIAADQADPVPIPVELWHGEVWQAEFDGRWYLAGGRPVYEVGATATFAVVSGVLLLLTRVTLRRRARAWDLGLGWRLLEETGQALLLAGGIWWLDAGSLGGLLLVVADAAWVIRSVVTLAPMTGPAAPVTATATTSAAKAAKPTPKTKPAPDSTPKKRRGSKGTA